MHETERQCRTCGRTLVIERFHRVGKGYWRRDCKDCYNAAAREKTRRSGGRVRHPRYNSRGDVWCNRCQQYRSSLDFTPHPSRPGKLWSYCKACVRELDRERYRRKVSTLAGAEEELEKRNQRKRRHARAEDRARRDFVAASILLLRRRGLTKADISRLLDTSMGSVLEWERKARRVTPAVERRVGVVVRETMYLPVQDTPVYRRRLPHPDIERLMARCLPQVRAIPVRSRWHKHERRAA